MATQTPAKQLYDLLVSRNFDIELLDSSGKSAENPAEAEVFSFDYTTESGNDYGTVVIMLGTENDLEVYFGDNIGRGMEIDDKNEWFDFLYQIRMFAKRNLMSFGLKNLNRLRYSMQGQAAIKEGLFESWTGTKTVSYNDRPDSARLMIKHSKPIQEGDKRYRYVEKLFVETSDGERYKLPFTKLSGGRAMVEHVRQGGKPYDQRGQHIAEMVNELNVLSRFRRANYGKIFEGDTAQLVEQTNAYYETANKTLKHLSSTRGYTRYFESWNPAEVTEQEVVIEGIKHLFVTQSIDHRIEEALPILARIQQQGTDMKEANIFETWASNLVEGTWQLPDTPEKKSKLVELLSQEFPVGTDATNSTEQLYDLLGDDELFDELEQLATQDPDADCRQVVYDRLQMLSDNPDIKAVIDQVQIDPEAAMNPAPEVEPGEIETTGNIEEVDEVKDPATQTEDPAGTKQPAYPEYQDDLASILRAAGVDDTVVRAAPDYETGVDEGAEGTTGQIIKKLLDPLAQGLAGSGGKSLSISLVGEEETDEETDVTTAGEKIAGMTVGGSLGGIAGTIAGTAVGGPIGGAIGGIAGGTLGAGLGNKVAQRAGNKNVANNLNYGANDFKQNTEEGELTKSAQNLGDKLGDIFNAPSDVVGAATSKIWHGDRKHPDIDEEETDEGWKGQLAGGTVGALAGGAAGAALGPIGSMIGGAAGGTAGQMIGDKLGGKEDDESPLKGKYGHSGKMKEVAEHADFLTRLKQLSGMMRN